MAVAIAPAAVFAAWRRGASLAPLWLLALLGLPWLPPSLPAAFFVWSGPLAWIVWAAIALSLAASMRLPVPAIRRGPLTAGVLAGAVYAVAASQMTPPSVPSGDEPHYLIITQSLLNDGDLRIENNHQSGDYRAYFPGELPKPDFRRLGRDRQIYSIHAPGLPVLVAPAFAIAGYRGVQVFLILLAAAGSALAWHLCLGRDPARGRGVVRLGRRDPLDEQHLSQLHGVPGRPGGRDRADRRLGAPARATGGRKRGRTNRSLVAARRGIGRAAVAAHAVCARRGVPWGAGVAPPGRHAQCRGKGGRVPERAGGQRDRLDRVLHRDLRDTRSSGAVRERGGIDGVHPGRPRRVALRPAVRPARLRAGARLRVCRAGRDGQESRDAPRRPRAAVRPRPVSSRRHAFRDVVGRPKRPRALLRADALHAGDPVGSRVGGDAPSGHASHGARRAARDGVRLVRAGVRRRRPSGLQRSRRLRRLAGMARTRNRSRAGAAGLVARQRRDAVPRRRDLGVRDRRGMGPPACRARDAMAADARRALRRDGGRLRGCSHVRDHVRLDAVGRRRREPDSRPARPVASSRRRAPRPDVRAPVMASPGVGHGAGRAPHRASPLDDPRRRRGHRSAVVSGPLDSCGTVSAAAAQLRGFRVADGRRRAGPVLDPQRTAGRSAGPDPSRFPRRRPRHRRARRRAGAPHPFAG